MGFKIHFCFYFQEMSKNMKLNITFNVFMLQSLCHHKVFDILCSISSKFIQIIVSPSYFYNTRFPFDPFIATSPVQPIPLYTLKSSLLFSIALLFPHIQPTVIIHFHRAYYSLVSLRHYFCTPFITDSIILNWYMTHPFVSKSHSLNLS